ncbi:ribonuclease H-like domain-containing protein [Patescibacteria group bacterium]
MKKKEVVFDVETQKLFSDIATQNPGDLKISVVSAYTRLVDEKQNETKGKMYSFWVDNLNGLWDLFSVADRIIGFNTISFDIPALQPYAPYSLAKLKHFDMHDEIRKTLGRRIGLAALAKETLGTDKTDVGTNAVIYWQRGDKNSLEKLRKYCEADVLLTRDLYDHVLRTQKLKYIDKWNNPREFEVDFSYPEGEDESQIGLF